MPRNEAVENCLLGTPPPTTPHAFGESGRSTGVASPLKEQPLTAPSHTLQANVLSGSMILLVSSGLVGGLNLLYNLGIAHVLGAGGFGQASAAYTVLMLLSAVHLSFQLLCSKFVARNDSLPEKLSIYHYFHRRAWLYGIALGLALFSGRSFISQYLNLSSPNYILILALAIVFYIPLGARRGLMQGSYDFRRLASTFVLEAVFKVGGAFLSLALGWGVSGVIAAVAVSIVVAYAFSRPHRDFRINPQDHLPLTAALGEGIQASLFFAGQVIINNLDIILVKHFFPPTEAGVYAAIALVGRVVYMLSWSVVSSMFPFSAGVRTGERDSRAVLGTALTLVILISGVFTLAVWGAPARVWHFLLGAGFPLNQGGSYRALLVLYAATTGIYSLGVVLMSYEISRKIGNVSWVQLGFSGVVISGIYLFHNTLHDVIMVQTVAMLALLVWVSVPFLHAEIYKRPRSLVTSQIHGGLTRLRRVSEDEAIAEFLKSEFYQPEFDRYREAFWDVVNRPDLSNPADNLLRRALLYRRRGRLWREIPADTEWWQVELQSSDLRRVRVFPRDQWRRHSDHSYYLLATAERIGSKISESSDAFIAKLRSLSAELAQAEVAVNGQRGTVLLIGLDEAGPLTIIEGNHRMTAAALLSPHDAHLHFRFLCGFSPHMMDCCWYHTDLSTLLRYARNSVTWLFDNCQGVIDQALKSRVGRLSSVTPNLPRP
jgi:O-antigen/teichoic acid export membrane protein